MAEDFTTYVDRKRQEYVHGNHIEMQAMSEMYNRSIQLYCYSTGIYFFHLQNFFVTLDLVEYYQIPFFCRTHQYFSYYGGK